MEEFLQKNEIDCWVIERLIKHLFWFFFSLSLYRPDHVALGVLVPWARIKAMPPALGVWGLNHKTSQEGPQNKILKAYSVRVWKTNKS